MLDPREKVAGISILVNIGLAVFKLVLGTVSGSVAIVADGIHSTSDIVSSLALLLGLKLSRRKSKHFPYGLYKVENIIAIVSAMAIFFAGYEILKQVVFQPARQPMTHILPAMAGMLITIGVTYAFSRYEVRVGKAVGSPSLVADGEHIRTDMFSTIVVLLSVIGQYFGVSFDHLAAIVVTIFIAHAGWEILFEGVKVLLDASLERETLERIRAILQEEPGVESIKSLTGRNSGSYKFIEAELVLNVRDLERAHLVSTELERQIKTAIQNVDQVLIHYEPLHRDRITFAVMLDDQQGKIADEFGVAPYIALFTKHAKTNKVLEQHIIVNPVALQKTGKGIALAEFLVEQGVDVVFTRTPFHGKGPEYVFADANVALQIADETRLDRLIAKV
jgi:cation diffusion facilitator family transporter